MACLLRTFVMLFSLVAVLAWTGDTAEGAQFRLCLENAENGNAYMCIPFSGQDVFSIQFLHSYDRDTYRDTFRVDGSGRFLFIGAGGKSNLNGQGFFYEDFSIKDNGTWEISGIGKVMDQVTFIMGSRDHANHKLVTRGHCYNLSDTIPAGAKVRLTVRP
jgi:hypothetical protein